MVDSDLSFSSSHSQSDFEYSESEIELFETGGTLPWRLNLQDVFEKKEPKFLYMKRKIVEAIQTGKFKLTIFSMC